MRTDGTGRSEKGGGQRIPKVRYFVIVTKRET